MKVTIYDPNRALSSLPVRVEHNMTERMAAGYRAEVTERVSTILRKAGKRPVWGQFPTNGTHLVYWIQTESEAIVYVNGLLMTDAEFKQNVTGLKGLVFAGAFHR